MEVANVSELIERIDIVDYISQFVELEERNGEWWGLSPFKDEKTPSFSVRREAGVFYDYSSGRSGGLYQFVRDYFHCSATEAIDKLAAYAGYSGDSTPSKRLSATSVAKRFQPARKQPKQAKGTVLPQDYMKRYERREDKLAAWISEGISPEVLDKWQVRYDSFSDRLVYPVRNPDGTIVNVGGRTLDPAWKEKGLRKYNYYFQFGTIQTIFGLAENRESILKSAEIILFEGCKSVLLADTWGVHNAGAILTSHLSQYQMQLLAQLGCSVVFALDKDVNILADKNIKRLKSYVNVAYLRDFDNLLDEKDSPVDKGPEVFQKLYKKRLLLQ